MSRFVNICRVACGTTGTGTLTLGAAISGFLGPTVSMIDGLVYDYVIEADYVIVGDDNVPTNREVGYGTYTASGTTLTRNIINSTTGSTLNLAGDAQVIIAITTNTFRERLQANRTYYVRSDGSDSNNGLSNTAGGAFLTTAQALAIITGLIDFAGYTVTLQLQNTTWTASVSISSAWLGAGQLTIDAAGGTISTTNASSINVSTGVTLPGVIMLQNVILTTTTSGDCISHSGDGVIFVGSSVTFGSCAGTHMNSNGNGATIYVISNYSITGGANTHYQAFGAGTKVVGGGYTVTITGTPAFSNQFTNASRIGVVAVESVTFSGSATGIRYSIDTNAVVYTGTGGSATYFPGSIAGSTSTGGQYN